MTTTTPPPHVKVYTPHNVLDPAFEAFAHRSPTRQRWELRLFVSAHRPPYTYASTAEKLLKAMNEVQAWCDEQNDKVRDKGPADTEAVWAFLRELENSTSSRLGLLKENMADARQRLKNLEENDNERCSQVTKLRNVQSLTTDTLADHHRRLNALENKENT